MVSAPLPRDEPRRQHVLESLDILDTQPDPVLDGLVRSAAAIAGCPVSLISLVDRDRQWFKARTGIDATQTPRDIAFCAHAILGDAVFEVADATSDPRFLDNPLVTGGPKVRFYAGAPITVDGQNIGTLCVIDSVPHVFTAAQRALLKDLGKAVEHWIDGEQKNRAVRSAEQYSRELFESLGDAVILLDARYAFLDANAAASALLGHAHGALLQLRLHDVVVAHEGRWLREETVVDEDALLRHGATWSCVDGNGRRFPAEFRIRRIDQHRYLATIRDVEERDARNEQLRQLFLAVEQSTESIVSTDLASHVLYANPATYAMSGYSQAELIGQNARILGSGKTSAATIADLYAHLGRGTAWMGLLMNRRKDGSEYLQSATVTPLRSSDGKVTQYVAVMKDVTEERRMAEELTQHREHLEDLVSRRTEELAQAMRAAESANASKSAFLATMSHEIRTPMNGVVGILDVLRHSTLTPNQRDLVDTMGESAFALLGIIDDILDFSKIEAGRMKIERDAVDLTALVESVCSSLKPVARARDVVLGVFVDPRVPDWISTDPVRVRQILNNLIGNAIKFSSGSDRHGRVSVRAEATADGMLRLQVADNGIGIAAEAQGRIFRPFEQAEGSTTRSFGGTGLGLSICNRLVELLSGTIGVESQPGQGSVFTVVLPMDRLDGLPQPRRTYRLDGVHCMVVSVDAEVRHDWAIYLRSAGAVVQTLGGIDALRAALAADTSIVRVALIDSRNDALSLKELDALRAAFPMLMVVVGQGQSREPRVIDSGSVFLESRLVLRDSLLKAVAIAVGFEAATLPEALTAHDPQAVAPSVEEARDDGRLILVAEDNTINQKVISTQLGILGHVAVMTRDGIEALAAWRSGRFGLLLTDLHMPDMDGFMLARAIRAEEGTSARMPIVALTANALGGEGARCREAGMDDYMTKPVQLDELNRMLSRWLPRAVAQPVAVAPLPAAPAPAGLSVLDPTVLVSLIGDDPVVIAEFMDEFRIAMNTAAQEMRRAVDSEMWHAVREIAHRLKSSARSVGALAVGECCEGLEAAAKSADGPRIATACAGFDAAVVAANQAFAAFAKGPSVALKPDAVVAPLQAEPPVVGVVILDDVSADVDALTVQLQTLGVDPLCTWNDGLSALEWLGGRDTSGLLMLLDLHMPGMDGIDFMRRLAEQAYAGALAIVSSADGRVLETAAKLGAAQKLRMLGPFRKPIGGRNLQALLEKWHEFVPAAGGGTQRKYTANEVLRAVVNDEMVLHYQPKVSLRDGRVTGVEALVRWDHPVDGQVQPGSFVGVVEAEGGIDMLTSAIISLALRQARIWNDAHFSHCIAINVSMINLLRLDFPELLMAEAERHGVPFTDLRLEVTESRLMIDLRSQIGSLTRLKLKGIGLSIDDFGTGHSSLSQLRDIPFDELKIDQSFVHGGAQDPTQRAIFAASLGMAHDLGMQAVAEGVEDRADWDFARRAGADMAQGYFIARPMPAEELESWVARWSHRVKDLL